MADDLSISVERLREPILAILRRSDLSSISAKKVRLALADAPDPKTPTQKLITSLQIRLDDKQHKKQVDELIRECFDTVNSTPAAAAAAPQSTPQSNGGSGHAFGQNGHAGAAATPQPRLALPGMGGIPGSHATSAPAPSASAAAKAPSSSSSSGAGVKRTRKNDDIISDDEEDVEAVKRKASKASTAKSSSSKAAAKPAKKRKSATTEDGEKKAPNPNNPFNKPVILSDEMSKICGGKEMPRYMITKQLWAYIKEKDLQNPSNKREILCDPTLQSLFGKPTVDSFEMAKLITKHVTKKTE